MPCGVNRIFHVGLALLFPLWLCRHHQLQTNRLLCFITRYELTCQDDLPTHYAFKLEQRPTSEPSGRNRNSLQTREQVPRLNGFGGMAFA